MYSNFTDAPNDITTKPNENNHKKYSETMRTKQTKIVYSHQLL